MPAFRSHTEVPVTIWIRTTYSGRLAELYGKSGCIRDNFMIGLFVLQVFETPKWWNWHTRTTQNRMGFAREGSTLLRHHIRKNPRLAGVLLCQRQKGQEAQYLVSSHCRSEGHTSCLLIRQGWKTGRIH